MDISAFKQFSFICLISGVTGLVLCMSPYGQLLEKNLGLATLFKLRGSRPVPDQPVILAIDRESADFFGLQQQPYKWPRSIHADAVRKLSEYGTGAIGFDLYFESSRSQENDRNFAAAMSDSGNVAILQRLRGNSKSTRSPTSDTGYESGSLVIQQRIPSLEIFEKSAASLSPFPLPRYPTRLNQIWLFKEMGFPIATLPVTLYTLVNYSTLEGLVDLIHQRQPSPSGNGDISTLAKSPSTIDTILSELRVSFTSEEFYVNELETLIHQSELAQEKIDDLSDLLHILSGNESRFINYYGPPGTITTHSYHTLFDDSPPFNKDTLTNKTVFIGLNHESDIAEKDGFLTVFTDNEGRHISGVEIAATVYANLLENSFITPIAPVFSITLILVAGICATLCSQLFSPLPAGLICLGIGAAYLTCAYLLFTHKFIWTPFAVPTLIQIPVTHLAISIAKHKKLLRTKDNIQAALGYYIPKEIAAKLALDHTEIGRKHDIVHGVCLYSDLENYTLLSEKMSSQELTKVINSYYEEMFRLVKKHSGTILDIRGDSMLAIWTQNGSDDKVYDQSCLSALAIAERFNLTHTSHEHRLPTRIALHYGSLSIGNIGALDRYQYTLTGDTVNTVARLESLCKQLGTKLLVSEPIAQKTIDLVYRKIGDFCFVGKTTPVTVYELLGEKSLLTEPQCELTRYFSKAQAYFQKGDFAESKQHFQNCLRLQPEDGPSKWFVQLSEQYAKNKPQDDWNGVIHLTKK